MTLETFKNRGFEVVGALAEAPHVYFSADLKVYNDDKIGKMYELPIAHGQQYPVIKIGGSMRYVHVVVAALRVGYTSLKEYDDMCATRLCDDGVTVVVMHDDDTNKSDWWNAKIGTANENSDDALRNGCNTGKTAARPVTIHLLPDAASEIWEYEIPGDGVREAIFSSYHEAARALAPYSDLKAPAVGISQSARTGGYFSLKICGKKVKAWAFATVAS